MANPCTCTIDGERCDCLPLVALLEELGLRWHPLAPGAFAVTLADGRPLALELRLLPRQPRLTGRVLRASCQVVPGALPTGVDAAMLAHWCALWNGIASQPRAALVRSAADATLVILLNATLPADSARLRRALPRLLANTALFRDLLAHATRHDAPPAD